MLGFGTPRPSVPCRCTIGAVFEIGVAERDRHRGRAHDFLLQRRADQGSDSHEHEYATDHRHYRRIGNALHTGWIR